MAREKTRARAKRPWPLEEPIPMVCLKEDVCSILRLSMRELEELLKAKQLPLVKLPQLGRRPRYTGTSVAAIVGGRWPGSRKKPR